VHRSSYPSAAIAIGLAIAADEDAGFELSDRLSRHFGVFRELEGGRDVVFDPIFSRDTPLPASGREGAVHRRVYRAMHNVGRFRFVECAMLDKNGVPHGDITAFNEVVFPFEPGARAVPDPATVPVHRLPGQGPMVQEEYAVTPHGLIHVTIRDLDSGFERAYDVGA
jgi:hypothetical protein